MGKRFASSELTLVPFLFFLTPSFLQCHESLNSLHAIISTCDFMLGCVPSALAAVDRDQVLTVRESADQLRCIVNDALSTSRPSACPLLP